MGIEVDDVTYLSRAPGDLASLLSLEPDEFWLRLPKVKLYELLGAADMDLSSYVVWRGGVEALWLQHNDLEECNRRSKEWLEGEKLKWKLRLEAKTMSFSPRSWPNLQQVGRATAAQLTPQTGAVPIHEGYVPLDPDED